MRAFSLVALLLAGVGQDPGERPEAFTFLFWTDQELDPKTGDEARCIPVVEAMNGIAGSAWPEALGGRVETPDFVASAGDSCGWPSAAAVRAWNRICRERLKYPTRAVAGNHDAGGLSPSETFYDWLREDPFVKARASDNGLPAWTPPRAGSGIIPGIQYSFRHKGVVFLMPSPTYDNSGASPAGSSPLYPPDVAWLKKELAKHDPKAPKIVVNHFNAGSILNRPEIDAIYKESNVVLHLCGHWESVQHWRFGGTDWVMDAGHRGDDGTFAAVRVGRDSLALAHYSPRDKKWSEKTLLRKLPARW